MGISSNKPFSSFSYKYCLQISIIQSEQMNVEYFLFIVMMKTEIRIDNITDWGLEQFVNHYKDKKIKKEDIFHYVYAVLHNPAYRKKYELNLKREFPRIPFYKDFWQWAKWGKQLMDLHINYEDAKPYKLKVINK